MDVSVQVANLGQRRGTDVVEVYLAYPRAAGEPPEQLRAFKAVTLSPGSARTVHLVLDRHAFAAYLGGRWQTVPGTYEVGIATSSAHIPIKLPTTAP